MYKNRKSSNKSKRSNKSGGSNYEQLPIESVQPHELQVKVHIDKISGKEIVVIFKRTMKQFIYHSDDYYRDKGSKRNNF